MGVRRAVLVALGFQHIFLQRVVVPFSMDDTIPQPCCGLSALSRSDDADSAAGARRSFRLAPCRRCPRAGGPWAARRSSRGCAGDVPLCGPAGYHVAAEHGYRSRCGIPRRRCDGARRCSPHGDIAI